MKKALAVLCLAAFLGGCAAVSAPYKDALKRVGDIGPRIADDIRPENDGAAARKQAFLDLCAECRTLGAE